MAVKLKWKVGEKPTGRYRSFQRRPWPTATYEDTEDHAGHLVPVDGTLSYNAKIKETTELYVYVALRSEHIHGFHNRRLVKRAIGVTQAKALLEEFIEAQPQYTLPFSMRD